ncbi:NAD(P)-dependent oxidoreductase [Agrobacterium sp. ICMP 6402]|uniref:NAD-dependent epimerase/dehydratase family protein n=1 Tax=Agrobacterium sp. ICMP 6402 TaxID=2292443 RepID=UPI001296E73F|nr:NAD(P)-dependent oxidoreductase [Agrobacterium sp. ICMP 6402]MQB12432.1 NAD(P)-dependent oxidoreductase [Agrobacterium sp. ICMP 6402]
MAARTHFITGAAGLVGQAVAEKLVARGDRVTAVDRNAAVLSFGEVIGCDLKDVHRLHALAGGQELDSIIHCGAYSGPMVARDNPYDLVAVNVMGTANVLEIARTFRVRRFINCSSVSVYGPTENGPVREDVHLSPSTVYGATKLAAEALVTAFAREHGVDAASFRLSWVYGPNRSTPCFLGRLLRDALSGRTTELAWGRDFHRQYIHADDAANGLIAGLDADVLSTRVFNLTGANYQTLEETAALVGRILPQARISLGYGPDPGDDIQHEFDISAAEDELGYRPSISLEQGIRQFVAAINREHDNSKELEE